MNKSAGPTPTMTDAEIAAWVEMARTGALRGFLWFETRKGWGEQLPREDYANELARRAEGKGA